MLAADLASAVFARPRSGTPFRFPRDLGSHPQYRTEWWYITGWAWNEAGVEFGVQITFFRNRPDVQESNPGALAPKQLVFAHTALARKQAGRLQYDQRSGRVGLGLAGADETDTHVWLDDWFLKRTNESYFTQVAARDYLFDLSFQPTQPLLLQGEAGFSRKGPQDTQASYYYSIPHLAIAGTIQTEGERHTVHGRAWLDHEWSGEYLAAAAAGWDWTGINLDDGSALMAFRIRGKDGRDYWTGGTLRDADGRRRVFAPGEIRFTPVRHWRSPRNNVDYPVAMRVSAGELTLELEPMMDDQELDSRSSTGGIYWEGAVRAKRGAAAVGVGYLELTGYAVPLKV